MNDPNTLKRNAASTLKRGLTVVTLVLSVATFATLGDVLRTYHHAPKQFICRTLHTTLLAIPCIEKSNPSIRSKAASSWLIKEQKYSSCLTMDASNEDVIGEEENNNESIPAIAGFIAKNFGKME